MLLPMAFSISLTCSNCGKRFTKGPYEGDPYKLYPQDRGTLTVLTCPLCEQQRSYQSDKLVIITD